MRSRRKKGEEKREVVEEAGKRIVAGMYVCVCGSAERGTVYGVEVEWSGAGSTSSRVEWSEVEWRVEWRGVVTGKCAKVHFSRKPDRPDHYRCAAVP